MASRSSRNGNTGRRPSPSSRSARGSQPSQKNPGNRRGSGTFDPSAYGRNAYGSRQAPSRNTQPRPSGYIPATPAASPYSRNNSSQYASKRKGLSRGKKIGMGVLVAILVAVVGVGTASAFYLGSIEQALKGDKTAEELQAIKDVTVPTTNFNEPFYMMLIGSDAREGDDEAGQRSDTNILVRVDPKTATATLVSIPRDTKIDIDGYGTNKFNAAYNYGGAASTIREASQLCDVKISYYAEINFEKLIQLVDVVGGVEVNVPELIDDPDAGDIVIQPGLQTLKGEASLVFARSRAYVDGDFTRTSNQRLLIEGLVNKVLSLPATEIPVVVQKAAEAVTTNMAVNDILGLVMQFKNAPNGITMYSAMVPSLIDNTGEVSYVVADTAGLKSMMAVVNAGGDPSTVSTNGASVSATPYASGSSSGSYAGTQEYPNQAITNR